MRLTTKHLIRTHRLEKLISIQDWTSLRNADRERNQGETQSALRRLGLDKPRQEKNYEMCESRAEIKQDDIEVF